MWVRPGKFHWGPKVWKFSHNLTLGEALRTLKRGLEASSGDLCGIMKAGMMILPVQGPYHACLCILAPYLSCAVQACANLAKVVRAEPEQAHETKCAAAIM